MRKVEVRLDIEAAPETIIGAFVDKEMLRDWWGVERSLIEAYVGGLYTLTWNITESGFGYVSSGIIKEYLPDSILEIGHLVYLNPAMPILGPMTFQVRAIPKGNLTEIYLCQEGYQSGTDWDWYYNSVKEAWPVVARTLKEYLEKQ